MLTYRRYREQLLAPAMVLVGLLLLPWVLYLAGALPHTTRARNWSLMWAGIDIAEALGLMMTGILLWRRSPYRALPAAFTAAFLVADAWIDVTTSAPGHAKVLAIVMAAGFEVPGAVGCLVLSIRVFPRVPADGTPTATAAETGVGPGTGTGTAEVSRAAASDGTGTAPVPRAPAAPGRASRRPSGHPIDRRIVPASTATPEDAQSRSDISVRI